MHRLLPAFDNRAIPPDIINNGGTMKYLLPALALAIGLSACATIPQARNPGDCLVIGHLALEFPDGFLGLPPRTIASNLLLHFRDLTTNRRFACTATDGYFYFRGNGADEYRLERYVYSYQDYYGEYYLNDSIGQSFSSAPGKLVNLGQIVLRYEKPRISNRVTFAQATVFDDAGIFWALKGEMEPYMHETISSYWQYDRTIQRGWDDAATIAYLKQKDPNSPWLEAELAH
jgi:hypothetical protein